MAGAGYKFHLAVRSWLVDPLRESLAVQTLAKVVQRFCNRKECISSENVGTVCTILFVLFLYDYIIVSEMN